MEGIGRLLVVWAALMVLLALTIGATFLPLGRALAFISYAIAAAKAGLVWWFFMAMRRERGLARLFGLTGFVWAGFLLLMLGSDLLTRLP